MAAIDFAELRRRADERWRKLTSEQIWIRVGGGASGMALNARAVYDVANESVKDNADWNAKAKVSLVGSLGLMFLEPTVEISHPDGTRYIYGNVSPDEAPALLKSHIERGQPPQAERVFACLPGAGALAPEGIMNLNDAPAWNLQTRIATRNCGVIDPRDIFQYIARGGYGALHKALTELTPSDVVDQVKDSGLRGRGGAAFSAGVKWGFLAKSKTPDPRYVLCNGEEGDPGAFNDKGLIESDPHTILEGLILSGYATRASKGYMFIRHGHDLPIENMRNACEDAYEYGILGEDIFDSGFDFDVEVSLTGDSYVAGEETAMMEAIEGKRAQPRFKPPFPAAAGLWQRPTNINNVKTLSYVSQIVLNGSEWFKSIGTAASSGTALACLSGHIKQPGLYEVDTKTSIKTLLYEIGGGSSTDLPIKMIQTGGPLGGILGAEAFDIRVCFDEMKKADSILGSGGIIVGDESVSTVDLLRNVVAFNQFESCGKCFPCRLGYTHMLEVMDRMCKGDSRSGDLDLIKRIGVSMKEGSLCGHGQLGYEPVKSALRYFGAEFDERMKSDSKPVGALEDGSMATPTRTRP